MSFNIWGDFNVWVEEPEAVGFLEVSIFIQDVLVVSISIESSLDAKIEIL